MPYITDEETEVWSHSMTVTFPGHKARTGQSWDNMQSCLTPEPRPNNLGSLLTPKCVCVCVCVVSLFSFSFVFRRAGAGTQIRILARQVLHH